jgi:F0F1-type ATP synthase assembly protein I
MSSLRVPEIIGCRGKNPMIQYLPGRDYISSKSFMNSRKDDKRRSFQQLNLILSVGMVFPVSIVIGYGVGYMLDKWIGTTRQKIVFLLFGIAAGFVSFIRMVSQVGDGE